MRSGPSTSRRPGRPWLLALALGVLAAAWPAPAEGAPVVIRPNEPHAGYVYPAGGCVGTTFQANVGGQFLRDVTGVYVSGSGVEAAVVMWIPPPRPLDREQAQELRRRLLEIRDRRQATTPDAGRGDARRTGPAPRDARAPDAPEQERVELPDHPLLRDLESKSLDELAEVARYFFQRRNPLQRKRSIEETVKIEVRVAADAEPGVRDLRLVTRSGVSSPLRFHVGLLPEVRERPPLRRAATDEMTVEPPVVVNGQILPRDVDRFRLRATAGQRLVVRVEARGLIPYQADSVPGWMQAAVALFDEEGREVAYADEYRYDPDPVLFHEVTEDGEYVVEVRDAVSRGRDDFVYRLTVGEVPFITRIFPLGGREGELVNASVEGWNLHWPRLPLDTGPGGETLRETAWRHGDGVTNEVAYVVDTLPEEAEVEPNDGPEEAAPLDLPRIVNGRIGAPGDVDVYAFRARGGDEVVAEVCARRLGSPIDSLLRLLDADGNVLAWNDDHVPDGLTLRGLGLQTHHADSYLRARLPRAGTYFVQVTDVTRHGSEDHAYRLRLSPPRPDVDLYVTPSTLNVPAGRTAVVTVHALRRDGFDGDIDVALRGAPEGFRLGGARIPAGRDGVRMTLTVPRQGAGRPIALRLVGRVEIGREDVERLVRPADDVMQAFLWRHLVPARELLVAVRGAGRWVPVIESAEERPVRVPRGGKTLARFRVEGRVQVQDVHLEAVGAPAGVTVGAVKATHDGFTVEVRASREAERMEHADNLVVEVFAERTVRGRGEAAREEVRRFSQGFLPAVPFRVVRR